MPYVSLAQERFFNANKAKLQKQGVSVNEWNKASKGVKLPLHVKKKAILKKAVGKGGPGTTPVPYVNPAVNFHSTMPKRETLPPMDQNAPMSAPQNKYIQQGVSKLNRPAGY